MVSYTILSLLKGTNNFKQINDNDFIQFLTNEVFTDHTPNV